MSPQQTAPTRTLPPIGRWVLPAVPPGWFFLPGFGLQESSGPGLLANVTLKDDTLLAGNALEPYIRVQMELLRGAFEEPAFAGPLPTPLIQADEAMLLLIRHQPAGAAPMMHAQIYTRLAQWIGIVTLTAPPDRFPALRPTFEQVAAALRIAPEPLATAYDGAQSERDTAR